jgi:hypothetical protein
MMKCKKSGYFGGVDSLVVEHVIQHVFRALSSQIHL